MVVGTEVSLDSRCLRGRLHDDQLRRPHVPPFPRITSTSLFLTRRVTLQRRALVSGLVHIRAGCRPMLRSDALLVSHPVCWHCHDRAQLAFALPILPIPARTRVTWARIQGLRGVSPTPARTRVTRAIPTRTRVRGVDSWRVWRSEEGFTTSGGDITPPHSAIPSTRSRTTSNSGQTPPTTHASRCPAPPASAHY